MKSTRAYDLIALGYAPRGILIMQNIRQREVRDHSDLVLVEVMAQLSGCDQDSIQKLLNSGIPYLGFGEDLADEVDRPLHSKRMAFFASLDYNSTADDMSCCRNVK
jgi:hypothetical protein